MIKKPLEEKKIHPKGTTSFILDWLQNMVFRLFQKRYQDGKFSFVLLGVSLPIQILAWGWLAYQYCWTGEVTFTIPADGLLQKYAGWLHISPALIFIWPFAIWYFPYLSGGGKLAMIFFSLVVYRMTLWCTQILYRWYAWQEQLRQLQTQAADQLGYINNTITDWYGLVYIKFKETAPIYQHNAEYLIQQQLNKFQVGTISDFAQKHGQAAANHFQGKLEEIKQLSIQLLENQRPDEVNPAQQVSLVLEKKIQAELAPADPLPELAPAWWQNAVDKIQGIDWSHPQVKTVGYAIGGLILVGITYWGVHSFISYFFGGDKRIDNLAGVVTNHEKDIAEFMFHLQKTNESQNQNVISLMHQLQDNQKAYEETSKQLLSLQNSWRQPQVQNLLSCSEDILHLINGVDAETIGALRAGYNQLKTAVTEIHMVQEQQQTALQTISNHFYRLCDRLNLQVISELRPRR